MTLEELSPNALPFVDEEETDLRLVTPAHPIAHEA